MIGWLDLSLLGVDRASAAARGEALALHGERLKRCNLRLHWSDDFASDLPWGRAEFRDLCAAAWQILEYLRGNNRLLEPGTSTTALPVLEPPLAQEFLLHHREPWLSSLLSPVSQAEGQAAGLAVLTWPRQGLPGTFRICNAAELGAITDVLTALRHDEDWQAFLRIYHRPDLSGKRVVVLGGQRAWVERAGKDLKERYRLEHLRFLPPAYEENRNKRETLAAIEQANLLLVCTGRLKHSDTDHIKNAPLPCPRRDLERRTVCPPTAANAGGRLVAYVLAASLRRASARLSRRSGRARRSASPSLVLVTAFKPFGALAQDSTERIVRAVVDFFLDEEMKS